MIEVTLVLLVIKDPKVLKGTVVLLVLLVVMVLPGRRGGLE